MTDTEISRYMALLLRHKPEIAGLVLDKQGWADVDMLLKCISENMEPVSFERLCEIVKNDSKQRYSLSEDKSRIRANQGHSVNVDVGLKAAVPPEYLYHGTATRFVESIDRGGIIRKTRLYVHLSRDTETATQVGMRHGKPFIYRVSSGEMFINEADQKKLYDPIHSGDLGGGNSGRTVITGEQIVTVVNNYGKRTGKGVILKG